MSRDLSHQVAGVEQVEVALDGGAAGAGFGLGLGPGAPGSQAVERHQRRQHRPVRALDPGRKAAVLGEGGAKRAEAGEGEGQEGKAPLPRQPRRQNRSFQPAQVLGPFVQAAPEVEGGTGAGRGGEAGDGVEGGLHFSGEEEVAAALGPEQVFDRRADAARRGGDQPPGGPGGADQTVAIRLGRADPVRGPKRQPVRADPVPGPPAERRGFLQRQPLQGPRPGAAQALGQPPGIEG